MLCTALIENFLPLTVISFCTPVHKVPFTIQSCVTDFCEGCRMQ